MKPQYDALKKEVGRKRRPNDVDFQRFGPTFVARLSELIGEACKILDDCERIELVSKVVGKSYFAFKGEQGLSRAINSALFAEDLLLAYRNFQTILEGGRHKLTAEEITGCFYTVAMICCAARDTVSNRDQKTPGTMFEWLSAGVMRACLGVDPVTQLPVLNLDLKGDLPTDFVFDLGVERPKFHLPVKTSTRERAIQIWAHQRVLDGAYGVGRFLAVPIVLAETKLSVRTREVIEIVLPWQWRLYQMHIAALWNVAFLDAPCAYLALDSGFPGVPVCTVGDLLVSGGRLDAVLTDKRFLSLD